MLGQIDLAKATLGLSVLNSDGIVQSEANESYLTTKKGTAESLIVMKASELNHLAHAAFSIGIVPPTGLRVVVKGVIGSHKTSLLEVALGATLGYTGDDFSSKPATVPKDLRGLVGQERRAEENDWRRDWDTGTGNQPVAYDVRDKTYDFSLSFTCTDRGIRCCPTPTLADLNNGEDRPITTWEEVYGQEEEEGRREEGNRFRDATHLWLSCKGGMCKITSVVLNYPVPLRTMPGPKYPGVKASLARPPRAIRNTQRLVKNAAKGERSFRERRMKMVRGGEVEGESDSSLSSMEDRSYSEARRGGGLEDDLDPDESIQEGIIMIEKPSGYDSGEDEAEWACAACTYFNTNGLAPVCEMCQTPKS